MAYLVLARKYRPQSFKEIVGQEHVAHTLQNAIKSGKIGQAYLFAGPRGVGKTTAARIFAKALNCEKGPPPEPCNECSLCNEITAGSALDVLEIDGASNRGIDEIRTLRENVKFAPCYARYKIYIIDEVHQVTEAGFNALLKTLEEPPERVIFVFATTEPQNIPETILSRCQRFTFRLISVQEIARQLSTISKKEKIEIMPEAIRIIAQAASGSMRDGLSILDQVISFIGLEEKIGEPEARSVLGLTSHELLMEFSEAIFQHRPLAAIDLLAKAQEAGIDLVRLTKDLRLHFRNLLMTKISKSPQDLIDLSPEEILAAQQQIQKVSEGSLLQRMEIIAGLENEMKYTDQPRIVLELGLVKLSRPYVALDELIARLERLENGAAPTAKCSPQDSPKTPERENSPAVSSNQSNTISDNQLATKVAQNIAASWPVIIEGVREHKPTLAVCLECADSIGYERQTLILDFSALHNFQKQTVERPDNIKIAEEVCSQVLRTNVRVKIVSHPPAASNAVGASGIVQPLKREASGNRLSQAERQKAHSFASDPMVEKVLHIFEGEIIQDSQNNEGKG